MDIASCVEENVDLGNRNNDTKLKEMSSELGKLKQEVLCYRGGRL
jgi:hypothetical protein